MRKTLIQNTGILYARTFFSSIITIWSVRILTDRLGLIDYGILNIVLGLSILIGSIQQALSASGQKFITEATLENNLYKRDIFIWKILFFNAMFAVIILLLGIPLGEYLILNILTIPEDLLLSSVRAYHYSLLLVLVNIFFRPFSLLYFSHDNLSLFGFLGVIESLLKLILAFSLIYFEHRIESYMLGLLCISLIINVTYFFSAKKTYQLRFEYDKSSFPSRRFLRSVGWNFVGSASNTFNNQGQNVLLNMFFGPIGNSSRAISVAIKNTVYLFASNIQLAVNASVVREAALKSTQRETKLMLLSTRVIFGTTIVIAIPLIVFTEEVLRLWLIEIPQYSVVFTRIILVELIIHSLSVSSESLMNAKDKLKRYQAVGSALLLISLLISYIVLVSGGRAEAVYIVNVIATIFIVMYRLNLVEKELDHTAFFVIQKMITYSVKILLYVTPLFVWKMIYFDSTSKEIFFPAFIIVFLYMVFGSLVILLNKVERMHLFMAIRNMVR